MCVNGDGCSESILALGCLLGLKSSLAILIIFFAADSLAFHRGSSPPSIRSALILWSPSTVTAITAIVVKIDAKVVAEEIMNIMIICSLAACWTEDPPRIAPVIIPGMAMIPRTLDRSDITNTTTNFCRIGPSPHLIDNGC